MAASERGGLRSDNDGWDIVSGVGYTALVVAAWRALHTASDRPLATDDYAELFVTAAGDPHLGEVLDGFDDSQDSTVFPRLYGVQTRFFDEFFASAAEQGIRQAVIVAAGVDARAYRLDWPAQATVFEVDRPEVLEFKARVLDDAGAQPNCVRHEVGADLRADWVTPLTAAGFDPERPAAWSLEGLLPYLTDAAQNALLSAIGEISAPGTRLATGAVGSGSGSWEQLAELEKNHPGLRSSGDTDFSGLIYADDTRASPAGWLTEHGWTVDYVGTSPQLQARYGRNPPEVDIRVDGVLRSEYITATR